jgi:hypothetical protein
VHEGGKASRPKGCVISKSGWPIGGWRNEKEKKRNIPLDTSAGAEGAREGNVSEGWGEGHLGSPKVVERIGKQKGPPKWRFEAQNDLGTEECSKTAE